MGEAPDIREQEDCPGAEVCGAACDQHEARRYDDPWSQPIVGPGVDNGADLDRMTTPTPESSVPPSGVGEGGIERVDRYTVNVDGLHVRATEDQERRLRDMDAEQLARFRRIMGADS